MVMPPHEFTLEERIHTALRYCGGAALGNRYCHFCPYAGAYCMDRLHTDVLEYMDTEKNTEDDLK